MNQFKPAEYWETRLADQFDLRGVGRRNWGIYFNTWAYRVRRNVFLRAIRSLDLDPKKLDCLDVGAGTGFYVSCWLELGARAVTGIDITDVSVNNLKNKFAGSSFHRINIAEDVGELAGQTYDAISCMDVLFHIVDERSYRTAFENMYALLKPGGRLIFTEAFLRRPKDSAPHVSHRTAGVIREVLQHAGFRIVLHRPFLVLMNDPVDPDQKFMGLYWRILREAVERFNPIGAVVGAMLYPMELLLGRMLRQSPSTEIMVCQRPPHGTI